MVEVASGDFLTSLLKQGRLGQVVWIPVRFSAYDLPSLCFRTCPLLWGAISPDSLGRFTVWGSGIFGLISSTLLKFSFSSHSKNRQCELLEFCLREKKCRGAETFWVQITFFFSKGRHVVFNKDKFYMADQL